MCGSFTSPGVDTRYKIPTAYGVSNHVSPDYRNITIVHLIGVLDTTRGSCEANIYEPLALSAIC